MRTFGSSSHIAALTRNDAGGLGYWAMPISLPQRVPENAPGDFYVQAGCCMRCCLPHGEAGELMNDPSVEFEECYFRRQPETPDEVENVIRAIWVSEVACLRYGGVDQTIIRRIHELGRGECCDQPLIGKAATRRNPKPKKLESTGPRLDDESPSTISSVMSLLAAAFLVTAAWTGFFPAMVVSSLARPMQGEAVIVPWWICLASHLLVPTLIPFAISLAITRHMRLRLLVLVAFAAFALMWYWAGGDDLLLKAWRRGL